MSSIGRSPRSARRRRALAASPPRTPGATHRSPTVLLPQPCRSSRPTPRCSRWRLRGHYRGARARRTSGRRACPPYPRGPALKLPAAASRAEGAGAVQRRARDRPSPERARVRPGACGGPERSGAPRAARCAAVVGALRSAALRLKAEVAPVRPLGGLCLSHTGADATRPGAALSTPASIRTAATRAESPCYTHGVRAHFLRPGR